MPSDPQYADLLRPDSILWAGGILVLVFALVRSLTRLAGTLTHLVPTRRLLIFQVQTLVSFLLYILASILIVALVLRPSPQLLLAASGSAALAVGFGLKDIASSLIAGLTIVLERPFQVGDWVEFGDHYGEVVQIGIRTSRLITLDDNLVTVPNSSFLTQAVASANAGNLDMMVTIPVHVAVDADVDLAVALLKEVVVTSPYVYLNKPHLVSVQEVALAERFSLELLARCYVLDVRFQKALATDVTVRTARAFREHNLKRPAH